MIIRNINIISFGKIKNKKIDFCENLNVIYGKNESGKTTVASFIEAMLYSFPPRSDRSKYLPWDNSPAAGEMTISHQGSSFTFYRKFAQTPKGDVTEPKNLSLEGIIPPTRDAYRKTVYSQEGKCGDFGTNADIEARIANIMTTGSENTGALSAIKYLEKLRRSLNSGNKLKALENKISALEDEYALALSHERTVNETLMLISEKRNLLEKYQQEIKKLDNAPKEASSLYLQQLDQRIFAQKEALSQLPLLESAPLKPSSGGTSLIFSILCTCLFLIAGFFTHYAVSLFALVPMLLYFLIYGIKLGKYRHEYKNFLSSAGCSTEAEYEKMRQNREKAADCYNELLKEKSRILASRAEELNSSNSNIIYKKIIALKDEIKLLEAKTKTSLRESELIKEEIAYNKSLHEELSQKLRCVAVAIDAFNYARDTISTDFTPKVTEKAMEYLNRIAPKTGRSAFLSSDMSITVSDPVRQPLASHSFGFKEEMYICFRIAWSDFLYGKDFPLIFDDPFLGSDDYREKSIIDLLSSLARERQIIVFTNRKNDYYNQLKCNWVDISPSNDV